MSNDGPFDSTEAREYEEFERPYSNEIKSLLGQISQRRTRLNMTILGSNGGYSIDNGALVIEETRIRNDGAIFRMKSVFAHRPGDDVGKVIHRGHAIDMRSVDSENFVF